MIFHFSLFVLRLLFFFIGGTYAVVKLVAATKIIGSNCDTQLYFNLHLNFRLSSASSEEKFKCEFQTCCHVTKENL